MTAEHRVFLNSSKNKVGTTAQLAKALFGKLQFDTVNLVEFHVDQIGQESKADQKKEIIEKLAHAKIIVIGTPVYWSDMTGYLKTLIDRMDLDVDKAMLQGADVYLIVQGTEPSDAIPGITTVIEHVCRRFGMHYRGLARNRAEAMQIAQSLQ